MAHPLVDDIRRTGPALSVGLVSADLMALGADIARLQDAGVRLAHFDVMDGSYVPMLTVGPPFIRAVKTAMMKDVHLMVREPLASLGDYAAAGADIITIHPDACTHPHRVLQVLYREVRPHAWREEQLGIGALPEKEVAEPLLSARADEEIHVGRPVRAAVDRVRQGAGETLLVHVTGGGTPPHRVQQRLPRGVVHREAEEEA